MVQLLVVSGKVAVLLASSWVVASILRRRTPADRHQVWALGVSGALLLPLLSWSLPTLSVPLPAEGLPGSAVVLVTDEISARTPTAWPAGLGLVWAAGSVVVAIRVLRGHLAARRLSRASAPSSMRAALADAARALGVSGRVDLRRSEIVGSPMTIGILRPRILLPADADGWSSERLRAVLIHELGHVSRRDAAVQLVAQLVCVAYWWNPLSWLAARRLRIEREHACDDLVIGAGTRPSSYASDLLVVARAVSARTAPHAGAICAVDPSGTEARLRRILDPASVRRRPSVPGRLALRVGALGLAVTLARSSALAVVPRATVPAPVCGPPTADAPMAVDDLRREAEVTLGASFVAGIDACFPPDPRGHLQVHWAIDFWGRATEVCVTEDTLGDPAVTACVNERIAEALFPQLRDRTVDVSFPVSFP